MEAEEEHFESVHVDLPDHWMGPTAESLWAKPLGSDLYQIHKVPFYAYGINYLDIVLAEGSTPDLKPEVKKIVEASGHKTIRIIFFITVDIERQNGIIESLKTFGTRGERLDHRFIALDVEPDGKFSLLCERLKELLAEGILEFETGESRLAGSFDFYEGSVH
jgi:hypothetical protein